MPPKPTHAVVAVRESRAHTASAEPTGDILPATLPADALDDRIAIVVGTAVSGKTYAAKGFVERLFEKRRACHERRSARGVVGIARALTAAPLVIRSWRRPSCRCADHGRDGCRPWPDDRP
jgi:hypothetical protein